MEIELATHVEEKIRKLVEAGKYKNLNEFLNRAAETLLMAEEQAKLFNLKG